MLKKVVSRSSRLLFMSVVGILALAACSSTPTDAPTGAPTPTTTPPAATATAPPTALFPAPTATPPPAPTATPPPAPTATPSPTPFATAAPPTPAPTLPPTPEPPPIIEFCEYVQGVSLLTASAEGKSVAGVLATGSCNSLNLDDSGADAEDILSVAQNATIEFAFNGAAAAAYIVDVHQWPTGRPSAGRFAPVTSLKRDFGFPLAADASYPSFEYSITQPPGDYRIVVNAVWPDGNQAVFVTFRVQVQ